MEFKGPRSAALNIAVWLQGLYNTPPPSIPSLQRKSKKIVKKNMYVDRQIHLDTDIS
jgi:hypothetical protein